MKKEFEFQHYYKRWLGALPCLFIAIALDCLLDLLSLSNIVYFGLCIAIMFALLIAYYINSEKLKLFYGTGYYWTEDDVLFIQADKKTYEISNITELSGYVKSLYGSSYTEIIIKVEQKSLKLFSIPLEQDQTFKDSSLYSLYRAILSNSPDLQPTKDMFGHDEEYCFKKRSAV
jgi:hypothetical protein